MTVLAAAFLVTCVVAAFWPIDTGISTVGRRRKRRP